MLHAPPHHGLCPHHTLVLPHPCCGSPAQSIIGCTPLSMPTPHPVPLCTLHATSCLACTTPCTLTHCAHPRPCHVSPVPSVLGCMPLSAPVQAFPTLTP